MRTLFLRVTFILFSNTIMHAQSPSVCFNGLNESNLFGPTGSSPISLTSADFNNDGKADMATANRVSNDVSVLLGTGTGSFSAAINYSCDIGPYSVIASDFNGDGNADLATANYDSNTISVLFGLGNGTFSTMVNYSVGSSPASLVTTDLNGDGKQDIAVANYDSYSVSVLLNSGSGSFNAAISYTVGLNPWAVRYADFNNDGNKDLVTANRTSNTVSVLLGSGSGSFTTAAYYNTGVNPRSMTCADFNGDGNTDIVTVNTQDYSVLLGSGSGTFSSTINYTISPISQYYSVLSADFNQDLKQDLLIVSSHNISILFGTATGTFGSPIKYNLNAWEAITADFNGDSNLDIAGIYTEGVTLLPGTATGIFNSAFNFDIIGGNAPYCIITDDFNKDGHADIVTSSISTHNVSIMFGSGNASLSAPVSYSTGISPRSVSSADFNNDGNPDLVTSNLNSNTISVLLGSASGIFSSAVNYPVNSMAPFMVITDDFNGDGNADVATANVSNISVLLGQGSGGFLPAANYGLGHSPVSLTSDDFNNDGYADIAFTDGSSHQAVILLGNGNGTFPVSNGYNVGQYPISIISDDFNGDGRQDLATANGTSNDVSVLLGLGTGGFSASVTYSIGLNIKAIASADLNKDNKPDLIVANNTIGLGNISILMGLGTGTFGQLINYEIGGSPYAVTTADFNENGNVDIATANFGAGSAGLLLNNSISLNPVSNVCAGNSVSVIAGNAVTYAWSTGATTNSIIVNPTTTTTYTVTGTNISGCSSSTSFSIQVSAAIPALSINALTNSVCAGSSINLAVSGADTYSWSTGSTSTTIAVTPVANTTYSVTGANACGTSSESVTIMINPTCADVWPGDANSDGTADNLDILELGLHYTQTGPARAATSNSWQSYFSNNWSGNITNGKNLNHSDCNGNGTINDDDTLAIFNNYGLAHAFKGNQQIVTNPQLSIVPDQAAVVKGTWGSSSVYLGEAGAPVNTINGIAFTVNFDNTLLEANSIWIEYPVSFINASNQNLHFRKLDFSTNSLYTATTHTLNNNVSGNGLVAILHYQIKSSLASDEILNLGIVQANQSNASGTIFPLTTGTTSLMAMGSSVSIRELSNGSLISVAPNPAHSAVSISSSTNLEKVEVVNLIGQVLISELAGEKTHRLNVEDLANGVYFVKAYDNFKHFDLRKLVIQK